MHRQTLNIDDLHPWSDSHPIYWQCLGGSTIIQERWPQAHEPCMTCPFKALVWLMLVPRAGHKWFSWKHWGSLSAKNQLRKPGALVNRDNQVHKISLCSSVADLFLMLWMKYPARGDFSVVWSVFWAKPGLLIPSSSSHIKPSNNRQGSVSY